MCNASNGIGCAAGCVVGVETANGDRWDVGDGLHSCAGSIKVVVWRWSPIAASPAIHTVLSVRRTGQAALSHCGGWVAACALIVVLLKLPSRPLEVFCGTCAPESVM